MADTTFDYDTPGGLRVAIIGAGRMGTALARALRDAGIAVDGPLGRGADAAGADAVLLCVPDDAIGDAVRAVRPGPLVGHCSGASTLAPLAPHERFSLHPLLAVAAPDAVFAGAACAVAGSTDRAFGVATALARALAMTPIAVAEMDRALYHAAATFASNYLVTLEGAATRLAARVGVRREHLVPLVRATVDNWARLGAERALTGPIARGDDATVERQRAAVASADPGALPLWDALAEATRRLAAPREVP